MIVVSAMLQHKQWVDDSCKSYVATQTMGK